LSNGAKKADLLYGLVVAEMDAAVARHYVAANIGIAVEGEAQKAKGIAKAKRPEVTRPLWQCAL